MYLKDKKVKSATADKSKKKGSKKPMSISAEEAYRSNKARKTSPKGY